MVVQFFYYMKIFLNINLKYLILTISIFYVNLCTETLKVVIHCNSNLNQLYRYHSVVGKGTALKQGYHGFKPYYRDSIETL
jgi:hypothetical protein